MSAIVTAPINADIVVEEARQAAARLGEVRAALAEVIFGQEVVVERALTTVLSGGHGLLVGVPGLAKTKLVDAMGTVLGLSAAASNSPRPDALRHSRLGILEESVDRTRSFRFVRGPVFAQLLMADEITAQPRTQSALLQAMQEHHVTIAASATICQGRSTCSPRRTRSSRRAPIRARGAARPLPMQIDVLYPDLDAERRMLFETTGGGGAAARRAERRRPDGNPGAGPPHAGRRGGREAILKLVRSLRPARRAPTSPRRSPGVPARAPASR